MSAEQLPRHVDGEGAAGPADLGFARFRALRSATLDAVFSGQGLGAVAELTAEAVGAPTAIVVPDLQTATIAPAEHEPLMSTVTPYISQRITGGPVPIPDEIHHEVLIKRNQALVGAIVLLAPPSAVPDAIAAELLHVAAASALTHLESVELRTRISAELTGSLFEQIRGSEPLDARTLAWRASRLGTDLSQGAVALCVRPQHGRPSQAVALIRSEHDSAIAETIDDVVFALLPFSHEDQEQASGRLRRLYARLRSYGPIGVSGRCTEVEDLRHAVAEAEFMLGMARDSAAAPGPDSGAHRTYHLLYRLYCSHPQELVDLYEATVAPLVRYDDHHRTGLVETLVTYLEQDGNMNATAARVFAHRHTVAYRIDRIRELTGLDPARTEDRERLGLGAKAYRILQNQR